MVKIEDFGKDHWSMMAYLDCRATDNKGTIDMKHLRIKNPMLRASHPMAMTRDWKPEYGTRLRGYFLGDGKTDKSRQLPDHDDHDCMEDLEAAGLIEDYTTGIGNGFVKLTERGWEVAKQLRKHKADGGHFYSFVPDKTTA